MITRQWRRKVCVSPTHVNNMHCSKVLFFFINEKVTREKKVRIALDTYTDRYTPVLNISGAMRTADEITKCSTISFHFLKKIYQMSK